MKKKTKFHVLLQLQAWAVPIHTMQLTSMSCDAQTLRALAASHITDALTVHHAKSRDQLPLRGLAGTVWGRLLQRS